MPWDKGHDLDVQSLQEQKGTSATLSEKEKAEASTPICPTIGS
jgi:hypothetical protein